MTGFEPATNRLKGDRSTVLSYIGNTHTGGRTQSKRLEGAYAIRYTIWAMHATGVEPA